MKAIRKKGNGVLIDIIVSPNSKREGIKGYDKWRDRIVVDMKEKPAKFKVNRELISFFSSLFSIPKNSVRIVAGEKNPLKTIFLEGTNEKRAKEILEGYLREV